MRQLVAGNWKMHGCLADALHMAVAVREAAAGLSCDLLICPPATLLQPLALALAGSPVAVGGQDCHSALSGPHTGDISAAQVRETGASWVIVGHSERRADHHESDALVCAKARAAAAAGLQVIVCIGETEAERLSGRETDIVRRQLAASLPDDFAGVVAYEPIWAIGTGRIAGDGDVANMHAFIRAELVARFGAAGAGLRILYGGSVKPENAANLMALPEVGGALVGGASLRADSFLAIAAAAADRAALSNRDGSG